MIITDIPGISTARAKALQQSDILTAEDLAFFFPRIYIDKRRIVPIGQLAGQGEKVTVTGRVHALQEAGFGRKKRLEVILADQTGQLKGVWFKRIDYFRKMLNKGDYVSFYGSIKRFGKYLTVAHPDVDKFSDDSAASATSSTKGIIPVYSSSQFFKKTYITSGTIQKWILTVLDKHRFKEFLPAYILEEFSFPERNHALRWIHSPETPEQHHIALQRFKFEEFFLFELSVYTLKKKRTEKTAGLIVADTKPYTHHFFNKTLPFQLTQGQKNSLSQIKVDMRSGHSMNRLIQGDVGSGKTVVAIGAMLMAIDSGYQAAMMAPTEILAEQHARTLTKWLNPAGVSVRLLTGKQKKALRDDILTDVMSGRAHIVVGTHAIIQESIQFHRLGLVVIDEQHRFGVAQRALLRDKGLNPHILVMSATPIPRSLAMTLYSDLDLSVIRDLPPGRTPVSTRVLKEGERKAAYSFVKKQIEKGGQVYVIYPLVEESEALDLKNATEGYEQLKADFPDARIGLLHGRMRSDEKESVMDAFTQHDLDILVSTTVIEVGVDVPNASVMLIEHAERFGLSQLHQLRGRIGRGERKSFCFLMTDYKKSKEAQQRLRTMEETNDGFKIAEADLKLRGPGDFLGTRQSGLPEFRFADILNDSHLLEVAKKSAGSLLQSDPGLNKPEHSSLRSVFLPYLKQKKTFFNIS
ncbi:ATP-dependent DNA helicase RecG [Balneolaceae bacterium ANBcel3]|nr:ATP-dependent DNA helicase RecG [Balneolaceae bacterium ANBcel3]